MPAAEVNIFNISSNGGTSTMWLTDVLNQVPGVVAIHGLRNNPFLEHDELPPERMAEGIINLSDTLTGVRSIGIVHTYRNEQSRDAFVNKGGTFAAMFRNPYERIHSLFTHHYKDIFNYTIDADDVYSDVASKIQLVSPEQARQAVISNTMTEVLSPIEARFEHLVRSTLISDVINLLRVPENECMLFERMHKDQDYLVSHLERVTKRDPADIAAVVSENRDRKLNKHIVGRRLKAPEIYQVWPPAFRAIFDTILERMDKPKVTLLYNRFEYEIF